MASDKLGPTETNGNGNGKSLEDKNLQAELEQTLQQSENQPEESEEFVKQVEGVMDLPQKTIDALAVTNSVLEFSLKNMLFAIRMEK